MESTEEIFQPEPESAPRASFDFCEYRVYEHPLFKKAIVKVGPCWPALVVGPAYLLYRRLWLHFIVSIAILATVAFAIMNSVSGAASIDWDGPEAVYGLVVLVCSFFICILGNEWREHNLQCRGFLLVKSVRARSVDDALAIIEREKLAKA